jgi:hypothetical protein
MLEHAGPARRSTGPARAALPRCCPSPLLPFPLLFWPWQAAALVVAILLGRRREHTLILTLRDGRAHRHVFADRPAALAHGQGVRRALGQVPGPDP